MIPRATGSSDYFDVAYRDYVAQNPDRKLDHYLDTIHSRLPQGPDVRLLDVGCGKGAFLHRANQRFPGWELYGTDVEPLGIAEAQRLIPAARIAKSDAADVPFPEVAFDAITLWDVLEHVEHLDRVPMAVRSMLKPDGIAGFVVPVYDGVTGPLIRRLDRDKGHIHKRSRSWWLEWADSNFSIVTWHGILRYLVTPRLYLHVPTRVLRNHTPAILVVAECH